MHPQSYSNELILASTSRYRQALLQRLNLPFTCQAPNVDESPLQGEPAASMVQRLALSKAQAVASSFANAVVIGSDQLAEHAGRIIGKPGNREKTVEQLLSFSGQTVNFYTATAVVRQTEGFCQSAMDTTVVRFRDLGEDEVRRYVDMDNPLDCAGGFKSESAGSMLMQSITCSDPSAIIGLPLIALSGMLRAAGFNLP